VAAYREALKEFTRERVPYKWSATQNNLGVVLMRLGQRESETTKLEEAVAAYREALKERTREHEPLKWAQTQSNLAGALTILGRRETGTAKLEEAVLAYREALKEFTRERVPLDWAKAQHNLGALLQSLVEDADASGTAKLGTAMQSLVERESGTAKLEEAVVAYREALKERTRERVPLDWAPTHTR